VTTQLVSTLRIILVVDRYHARVLLFGQTFQDGPQDRHVQLLLSILDIVFLPDDEPSVSKPCRDRSVLSATIIVIVTRDAGKRDTLVHVNKSLD